MIVNGTKPLVFVTWKWKPKQNYRSTFNAETVNVMARMIGRHFHAPHEVVCITDDAEGIDESVRIVPLWDEFGSIQSPHGPSNPSCYRRLKAFSIEAAEFIGPRFVSIDLDAVITGDITSLFLDDKSDFRIWADTNRTTSYNGSLWLMDAGARRHVYERFEPTRSPFETKRRGMCGSDQAWISMVLGPNEKKWTTSDGIYSWRIHCQPKGGKLPDNAKIVFFHGKLDPWHPDLQKRVSWIREQYR